MPAARRAPSASLGTTFLVVWTGQTLSAVGSAMSAIGVAVHLFVATGSAFILGVVGALVGVMSLVAAPLGPLIDRFSRRSVMIVADSVAALGPAFALLMAWRGDLQVWHLVVASTVAALGGAVQAPAASAVVPQLVPHEALGRANGLAQLGPAAGVVIGPVLATPLVAAWGIEAVLVIDLVTFAIAMVSTAAARFAPVEAPSETTNATNSDVPGAAPGRDHSMAAGWRWLRTSGRPLLTLIVAMAVVNLALGFFNVALQVLALEVSGTARAGLVVGVAGLAMVGGSIWVGVKGVPAQRVRAFAAALGVFAVGAVVAAARPWLPTLLVGVMVALVAAPVVNAAVATVFHERVPASMHGRVFAVRFALGRSLDPVGTFAAGAVIASVTEPLMRPGSAGADTIGRLIGEGPGRGAALVLLVVAGALAGLAMWMRRVPGLRALDTPPPAVMAAPEPTVAV